MTLNTCLKSTYSFSLLFFIFFKINTVHAQVYGCTDPLANNYNSSATVNDGKCAYNPTSYTPTIKVDPISNVLIESSGLQMAGNYLWSFNDGGGAAAIYRIDTLTNAILQTVNLSGATNVDWEDIAFDGTYFYIGDFGNNASGARTDLKIYKFPFSAIPDFTSNPVASIPSAQIGILSFIYNDQQQPPVAASFDSTDYDCEAMLVDGGKIHLFTKNWLSLTTRHYIINTTLPGNYLLDPVETLSTGFLVTAADKAPGHSTIALLGYQNSGFGSHFLELLTGYADGYYFNGNKRTINLPNASIMGQSEGLTFRDSTYGYISNEKFVRSFAGFTITVNQKLRSFDIKPFISSVSSTVYKFIGNGNWNVSSNWLNNNMPPSTITAGSQIIIDPVTGGGCILNIPYTLSSDSIFTVNQGKEFLIQG
ncbi:MAG: hypothetical protein M3015_16330, partial [Bacteroidota bacterium]|nr:hypothetical protein [Bacteroidota bacterium]